MAETAKDLIYLAKTYTNFSGIELPEIGQHSQTFAFPLLRFGTSTNKVKIGTASTPVFDIRTTSALTTGQIVSALVSQTMTGVSSANTIEVLQAQMTANVQVGDWANAVAAKLDFSTSGRVSGTAGAVCAEIDMPNSAGVATGSYFCYQAEMNFPASTTIGGGTKAAIFGVNLWGAGIADFDTNGYLWIMSGYTEAAGKFVSADILTVKCLMEAATRYVVLSEAENGLSLGLSGSANAVVSGTVPFQIYTTSSDTSGNVVSATIDQTMTGASTTNTIEAFQSVVHTATNMGDWMNAILGKLEFTNANGRIQGTAGAICAEVDMPDKAGVATGSYFCFEGEMNFPTNTTVGGGTHAGFFILNAWGAGVAGFDAEGVLFEFSGVSSGSTNFWYDHDGTAGGDTVGEWVKVRTPSGVRYLGLYDATH